MYTQVAATIQHIAPQHICSTYHTLEFINPTRKVTGEKWRKDGVHAEQLHSHLDEFMWQERYRSDPSVAFNSILVDTQVMSSLQVHFKLRKGVYYIRHPSIFELYVINYYIDFLGFVKFKMPELQWNLNPAALEEFHEGKLYTRFWSYT